MGSVPGSLGCKGRYFFWYFQVFFEKSSFLRCFFLVAVSLAVNNHISHDARAFFAVKETSYFLTEGSPSSWPVMAFYSLIRTFHLWWRFSDLKVQSVALQWLHLRKAQINLLFHSVCTTFAPKLQNDEKSINRRAYHIPDSRLRAALPSPIRNRLPRRADYELLAR